MLCRFTISNKTRSLNFDMQTNSSNQFEQKYKWTETIQINAKSFASIQSKGIIKHTLPVYVTNATFYSLKKKKQSQRHKIAPKNSITLFRHFYTMKIYKSVRVPFRDFRDKRRLVSINCFVNFFPTNRNFQFIEAKSAQIPLASEKLG